MAKVAKITITVTQAGTGQTIQIATTGKKGATLLNDINNRVSYPSQSPWSSSVAFYTDVLTKAITQL